MKKDPNTALFFYQDEQLSNTLYGHRSRILFRAGDQPLTEVDIDNNQGNAKLLATDIQGSILQVNTHTAASPVNYTAFGYRAVENEHLSLLGFNAQPLHPLAELYLLGNGYRAYSPIQMRFITPDSLSPFDAGGINTYSYCEGNPVNYVDPSGHAPVRNVLSPIKTLRPSSPTQNEPLDLSYRPPIQNEPLDLSYRRSPQQKNTSQPNFNTDPDNTNQTVAPNRPKPIKAKNTIQKHTSWKEFEIKHELKDLSDKEFTKKILNLKDKITHSRQTPSILENQTRLKWLAAHYIAHRIRPTAFPNPNTGQDSQSFSIYKMAARIRDLE